MTDYVITAGNTARRVFAALCLCLPVLTVETAMAESHSVMPMISARDQDVSRGVVTASVVVAPSNGWMAVHRTPDGKTMGDVIGFSPLRAGDNVDVAAILIEPVEPGEMLLLMIHDDKGGTRPGVFEYAPDGSADAPVKYDCEYVMLVIRAL